MRIVEDRNGVQCRILLVSSGPQLVRPQEESQRNWLPLTVAVSIVLAALGGMLLYYEHGKNAHATIPASAPTDPYAANLTIGNLAMSESSNLSGGKVTYLDGQIANHGQKAVTGITVQVIFRDAANEIAWSDTQSLRLIRTREPYVDVEPVSAAPLKPGTPQDFRLVFDTVPDQWDGAYPEIRIIHIETR